MKNIGLVGLGFIGKAHLNAYQQIENAQVTTICTKKETMDTVYGGDFVTEYDDLLSKKEIDIVDICLPTYLHEEYIIKAAKAGKHIICEKPLTLSVESANRILKVVQEHGVKLFVGHVLRFWPEYKVFKTYSESDKLKEIKVVHAKRLGQVPNWSTWFQDPEKSGGALFDLHIHDIDFLYYLLGETESVYAVGHKNLLGAWDHVMTTLTFKNGGKAFVEASQRMQSGYPFTMALRTQTDDSILDFSVAAGENIENLKDSQHQFRYYSNNKVVEIHVDDEDPFKNELAYFVNCIEKNEENTMIPLDEVMYTLKLLEAIQRSLETESVVYL
ncbi:Gfo/Idh/MocA family protein [Cytobacillus sp. FJAT-54145]|uniref:Gfo/Idh/MocA family protein n=1 Tax=Cytobacillus spartinae TaxID=3299023 RepID=A0ABW6K6Q2_9BACI